jgi:DnaJ-class molecular chaperone
MNNMEYSDHIKTVWASGFGVPDDYVCETCEGSGEVCKDFENCDEEHNGTFCKTLCPIRDYKKMKCPDCKGLGIR